MYKDKDGIWRDEDGEFDPSQKDRFEEDVEDRVRREVIEEIEKVAEKKIYTGYCDRNGRKIYYGDWLEFNDSSGAVWQSRIIMSDGYPTIDILNVENIKNPDNWDQKYDWIESRWWSIKVGYGEMGTWNCPMTPLVDIAGFFKSSDEMFKVRKKFNTRYGKYHSNDNLERELPVLIVKDGDLEEWRKKRINRSISESIIQSLKGEIMNKDRFEEDVEDEEERCEHCGHTPESGACFYCKMD